MCLFYGRGANWNETLMTLDAVENSNNNLVFALSIRKSWKMHKHDRKFSLPGMSVMPSRVTENAAWPCELWNFIVWLSRKWFGSCSGLVSFQFHIYSTCWIPSIGWASSFTLYLLGVAGHLFHLKLKYHKNHKEIPWTQNLYFGSFSHHELFWSCSAWNWQPSTFPIIITKNIVFFFLGKQKITVSFIKKKKILFR